MQANMSEGRPAYVQFEMRAVEDRAGSAEKGHPVYKDVAWAIVTAPGGTSTVIEKRAEDFLKAKANTEFGDHYRRTYQAWMEGQEPPIDGVPLAEWPGITPAQMKTCQAANIRSVEDLAAAPDDALRRIGIGARALQERAKAWLETSASIGVTSEELAALREENASLRAAAAELRDAVQKLKAEIDGTTPKRGPGRPKKEE